MTEATKPAARSPEDEQLAEELVERDGVVDGVIFRTDKGTPHCADGFVKAWERLGCQHRLKVDPLEPKR